MMFENNASFNNSFSQDFLPPQDNKVNADKNDIWMISDDAIRYLYTSTLAIFCGPCTLFGIVTNAINVIIFLRIGFQETINISLFALAISDALSLVALLYISICHNPLFIYSGLPVLTIEIQHYPGGWTHVIFTRVTGFITAFITLERCLCIAFPLKIKTFMTPKKVTQIMVGIYFVIIGIMIHNYFMAYIDWKWVPHLNRTMLGMIDLDVDPNVKLSAQNISMVCPILSFTSVTICTIIFCWKLNQRGKWMQKATSNNQEKNSSVRDRQVMKLVVGVAVIFIVCYIPSLLLFIVVSNVREMHHGGKYENFFILTYSIAFPMGAINSSVNIFVYYKMMSKYKKEFCTLFTCSRVKKKSSSSTRL